MTFTTYSKTLKRSSVLTSRKRLLVFHSGRIVNIFLKCDHDVPCNFLATSSLVLSISVINFHFKLKA